MSERSALGKTRLGKWTAPLEIEVELDEWGDRGSIVVGGVEVAPHVMRIEIEAKPLHPTTVRLELANVTVSGKIRAFAEKGDEGGQG